MKLTPVQFSKLVQETFKEYNDPSNCLRLGQLYFNKLHNINNIIAVDIAGTEFDPFYDDKKIDQFLTRLI